MVLALGIVLTLCFTALPYAIKRYSRISPSLLPVAQELYKPFSFTFCHHHRSFKYNNFSLETYFFKSGRRHYYANNLRIYSVFAWVQKFEQEELMIQGARKAIHQAKLAALRLGMLKAAVVFQKLRQASPVHPIPSTYENNNFLHSGLVHHLAQP